MKLRQISAAILALALSATASATVVYENGTDGAFYGGNNPFTYTLVTQNFTLDSAAVVNSLTYNAYTTGSTVPVTNVLVDFFADAGGSPGSLLFSGNFAIASQAVIGGGGYYSFTDYTVNLPNVSLAAGNYFLGLQVSPNQWDQHWSIPTVSNAGVHGSDGFAHYFRLESNVAAVPEPETYALMLAGLAAVATIARRKGKSAQA